MCNYKRVPYFPPATISRANTLFLLSQVVYWGWVCNYKKVPHSSLISGQARPSAHLMTDNQFEKQPKTGNSINPHSFLKTGLSLKQNKILYTYNHSYKITENKTKLTNGKSCNQSFLVPEHFRREKPWNPIMWNFRNFLWNHHKSERSWRQKRFFWPSSMAPPSVVVVTKGTSVIVICFKSTEEMLSSVEVRQRKLCSLMGIFRRRSPPLSSAIVSKPRISA